MKKTLRDFTKALFTLCLSIAASCHGGGEATSVQQDSVTSTEKVAPDSSAVKPPISADSVLNLFRRINDSLTLAEVQCNKSIARINKKLPAAQRAEKKDLLIAKEQLAKSEGDIRQIKSETSTSLLAEESKGLKSVIKDLSDAKLKLESIVENIDRLVSILSVVDAIITTAITSGVIKGPSIPVPAVNTP